MKKLPGFLRKHCGALLAGTLAALLSFALGWYGHADYTAAQKEADIPVHLTNMTRYASSLQNQQAIRRKADELEHSIGPENRMIIGMLRRHAVQLQEDLSTLSPPLHNTQPEVNQYLLHLCNYLLMTDYPDYAALDQLFIAVWPLTETGDGTPAEQLKTLAENLTTEKGAAAVDIVVPY